MAATETNPAIQLEGKFNPANRDAHAAAVAASGNDGPAPATATEISVAPLPPGLSIVVAFAGAIVTLLWLFFLVIGYAVPTKIHRDYMQNFSGSVGTYFNDWQKGVESLIVIGFAYTPMNLLFLCCLAALIGCLGRIAQPGVVRMMENPVTAQGQTERPVVRYTFRSTIAATMWGFFVFLLVISGSMIFSASPFGTTTPEQYLRLAGAASVFAFIVGWRPRFIERLIDMLGNTPVTGKTAGS